jgi:hypothetical protein
MKNDLFSGKVKKWIIFLTLNYNALLYIINYKT